MLTDIRKPEWLDKKIKLSDCQKVKALLKGLDLHTVCQEACCPNIGECFFCGEATFLILGKVCTRRCAFCCVRKGEPLPVDRDEPARVAEAVSRLELRHVVITSVTRDDLIDGGAGAFIDTVLAVRKRNESVTIELLIPDLMLNLKAIKSIVKARPDIIGHNVETVPRLYPFLRQGAKYSRSLEVLRAVKKFDKLIYTKSAVMAGLGEKEDEVLEVFSDLRNAGCDFLSIGQYLAPSKEHYPIQEYINPQRFEFYRDKAKSLGFKYVASGPYVRSSYQASEYLFEAQ